MTTKTGNFGMQPHLNTAIRTTYHLGLCHNKFSCAQPNLLVIIRVSVCLTGMQGGLYIGKVCNSICECFPVWNRKRLKHAYLVWTMVWIGFYPIHGSHMRQRQSIQVESLRSLTTWQGNEAMKASKEIEEGYWI